MAYSKQIILFTQQDFQAYLLMTILSLITYYTKIKNDYAVY